MTNIDPAQIHTEELRQFSLKYGYWGDYPNTLFFVIRNPKCDKATALYLFWHCDPVGFFELYADEDEALVTGDWCRDYYRLFIEIQEKYATGFYVESSFCVEPEKEAVGELTSDCLKTPILDIMYKPSC